MIQPEHLGTCLRAVTTHDENYTFSFEESGPMILATIDKLKRDLLEATQAYEIIKLEKRLGMLSARVAIVKVGANFLILN